MEHIKYNKIKIKFTILFNFPLFIIIKSISKGIPDYSQLAKKNAILFKFFFENVEHLQHNTLQHINHLLFR